MNKAEKQLQVILDEQNVSTNSMRELIEAFGAPFSEAGEILMTYEDIKVTSDDQTELMQQAREQRLTLKRIRTGVENKRKELKEDALKAGRAIDSVARYIRENIEPAEKYLELQEKFVELKKKAELEAKRAERTQKLVELGAEPAAYNLDKMTDGMFAEIIKDLQAKRDRELAEQQAAEEAARKAEQERLAEEQRMREENARLKAEAEERAKREAEERAKAEAEAAAAERERQAEYERVGRISIELLKYSHSIQTAEQADDNAKKLADDYAKLPKADQANDRVSGAYHKSKADIAEAKQFIIALEIKAEEDRKAAEEAAAKAEAEEAERQAMLAPDKEKLLALAEELHQFTRSKLPAVKSKAANDIVLAIEARLNDMRSDIIEKAKQL